MTEPRERDGNAFPALDPADFPAEEAGNVAEHNTLTRRSIPLFVSYIAATFIAVCAPLVAFAVPAGTLAVIGAIGGLVLVCCVLAYSTYAIAMRMARSGRSQAVTRVRVDSAVEIFEFHDFLRNTDATRQEVREHLTAFLRLPTPSWGVGWRTLSATAGTTVLVVIYTTGSARVGAFVCAIAGAAILLTATRLIQDLHNRLTELRVHLTFARWDAE